MFKTKDGELREFLSAHERDTEENMIDKQVMRDQNQPLCTKCTGYPVMKRREAQKAGTLGVA